MSIQRTRQKEMYVSCIKTGKRKARYACLWYFYPNFLQEGDPRGLTKNKYKYRKKITIKLQFHPLEIINRVIVMRNGGWSCQSAVEKFLGLWPIYASKKNLGQCSYGSTCWCWSFQEDRDSNPCSAYCLTLDQSPPLSLAHLTGLFWE